MENDKNLSAEESLSIITHMIGQAKGQIRKNSFYFLLWGWTIMLGHAGFYVLAQLGHSRPYLAWLITIPALIATVVRIVTSAKAESTRTHFDAVSGWLWLIYTTVIFSLIPFGWKINFNFTPVILLITAIPTTVSGAILKFAPLKFGGIVFWICGIIAFLVPVEMQSIVGAVAIAVGYLVPGYMLKNSASSGNL